MADLIGIATPSFPPTLGEGGVTGWLRHPELLFDDCGSSRPVFLTGAI